MMGPGGILDQVAAVAAARQSQAMRADISEFLADATMYHTRSPPLWMSVSIVKKLERDLMTQKKNLTADRSRFRKLM